LEKISWRKRGHVRVELPNDIGTGADASVAAEIIAFDALHVCINKGKIGSLPMPGLWTVLGDGGPRHFIRLRISSP
jgi:hypothetical protein